MSEKISASSMHLGERITRPFGRAVADFGMIRAGDRVLIGLSGGKDSLVLACALARLRERSPVPFELAAVTVDPTGGALDLSAIEALASSLDISFERVDHPLFDILRSRVGEKRASPCSLCANMRRGMLAAAANRLGCGTLALGHHLDDAVETVYLNLTFAGRFSCFAPEMTMDRSGVRVIRPLIYVGEETIARAAVRCALPVLDMGCEFGAASERAHVKEALRGMEAWAPNLKNSVLAALKTDCWRRMPFER